jgi:hypothetical protein
MKASALCKSGTRFLTGPLDTPTAWRAQLAGRLTEYAFLDVRLEQAAPSVGWVLSQDPLECDFTDINRWLYNQYALFSLRVDQKKIPSAKLKANVNKRLALWCSANDRAAAPKAVKDEIKEAVEVEMLRTTPASMALYPVLWNLHDNWLLFHASADTVVGTFRKLFHKTSGIQLLEDSPEGWLRDDALRSAFLSVPVMNMGGAK